MAYRPVSNLRDIRGVGQALPYLLTISLSATVTLGLYFFQTTINPAIAALLFLLPVGLSTALWGLGPGVTASLTAFLAFNYFFIQPYYTLMVHRTQDLLALLVFLIVAVVISQLVSRARTSAAQANDRERQAVWLYEFSNLLGGLHGEHEIAQAICDQTLTTFQADRVEVFITRPPESNPINIGRSNQGGEGRVIQADTPQLVIPLQTVRGLLGEIRLWRAVAPLNPAEERLLRTYASQVVLAIERARLLQTETRAQILEESDRLKTSLLSSVSHELRTPLATIKAAVSSLLSQTVEWNTEARQELLATVDEETDHLNQLVENLLNMSRIEAGVLKPNLEWNSLDEILASVLRRFQKPAQLPTHPIDISLPDDLPLVPVDFLQLEQVFTNLISNSKKYSPEGSLIRIQAWVNQAGELQVQVRNQGPQVPAEHLEQIFEKFHRITAAERITGTGLGLSICKGIIEAHRGKIWAENHPSGFGFNFILPLKTAHSTPDQTHNAPKLVEDSK